MATNTPKQIELGQEAKDKVTGFNGILTCRIQYLTGCDHYGIAPRAVDGKVNETAYFDEGRIEIIGPGITVKEVEAPSGKGGPQRDTPKSSNSL